MPFWFAWLQPATVRNGSDRDDIIVDNISSDMSKMDRSAAAQRAHVGCIVAPFDDFRVR
jgi:hypothetical protein